MTKGTPGTRVGPSAAHVEIKDPPNMEVFIQTLTADLTDIENFYTIEFSPMRLKRLEDHISQKLDELQTFPFADFDQQARVDWLLSKIYLTRRLQQTKTAAVKYGEMDEYFHPWAPPLIELCEWRQQVVKFKGLDASARMSDAVASIEKLSDRLRNDVERVYSAPDRIVLDRAGRAVTKLHGAVEEMVGFYRDYDPVLTWWLASPWKLLSEALQGFAKSLEKQAGNDGESSTGDIIGQPLGRDAILTEIEAECIPYSPEELIEIGEREFEWCDEQLELASKALGYKDPKEALEHTKNTFVEPGEQIYVVRDLAAEAVKYVTDRDMITIPKIANECWLTLMMTPERQRVNPFFLGGPEIIVSYPTADMCHEDKMMSMRGNNPSFSRATVQHELIPGHHLQFYYIDRYRRYRQLFDTPFWMEGWAVYWEFILWDLGFTGQIGQTYATNEAENRIGMLFWRMHRCARIIFSLKFHLGQMSPQECVDLLVDRVGHERATAEGEIRRSLNGDYSPLYQAGYMLGALQLCKLREELITPKGKWTEKEFHDRVMKENMMPIELLRALLKDESLSPDWQSQWKFYDFKRS